MAYEFAKLFSKVVTHTFFRDIEVIGQENIPKDGPILLYGNHNNQFIDPLLIISNMTRKINFIAAAKSMRKPIIGDIGKALGGIPVERPQDLAKIGSGILKKYDGTYLFAENSQFTKQCQIHDSILIQGIDTIILIVEIISDTKIKVQCEDPSQLHVKDNKYKIQPKVDQSMMFEQVWLALKQGKCIGIFPEGGSHDNTTLLPLKPGICIMALGASQKYQTKVKLQPVGLNYFKGHKFRSKVIVEFGVPYEISQQLIDTYAINKRQAISKLLLEIEQQLKSVTIQAPSYSHLSAVIIGRSLYLPDRTRLSPQDLLQLTKRFLQAFYKLKEHPEVNQVLTEIKLYNYKLKALGVRDWEVMRMQKRIYLDLQIIGFNIFMTILCLLFAFPGYIMTIPITIILNMYAEKERKSALAGSKVKISGKDVVASFKVLASIIIVPISVFIYTVLFYLWLTVYKIVDEELTFRYTIIFLLMWPIYITAMIRSNDGLIRHARKVNSQILFYLYENKYRKLKIQREELQNKIRRLVDAFGEEVIQDFNQNRIVQKSQLVSPKSVAELDIQNVFESLQELGI
ncbi:unnamed protein product (macronuclear) [Paramecium tetraurelia]|uniref:Phospholipid/glycerol acyltransferase domain-containing protein n=1 Tax=Paramecium tetraurelia TaxID=5888 RepID=A0CUE0_PARTE|nr:uncharacterized protein GSPATT00010607001 [Paramecium tetraurelia]CAK74407.1 unnamed protein product [Paramecium tetraurelia]|eukprot:XP_001441804.1 hypothetical protein (macronuclear) [Paramecium tetraurelia strain d4-2]